MLSAVPRSFPHYEKAPSFMMAYMHCSGMLTKMKKFLDENQIEKTMRWLGFIQGVLWVSGAFSLEELESHNRPDEGVVPKDPPRNS
jgi:hypothetical protein